MSEPLGDSLREEIAIVGMTGRFPAAPDLDRFWRNLEGGVDCISRFSDEELLAAGVVPELLSDPRYVKAAGALAGVDLFDAAFFGFSPGEAELVDPQQRLFLECAWEALESAGYNPEGCEVPVGVYAGVGMNNYLLQSLRRGSQTWDPLAGIQGTIGNDKDFLTTRVSYKLNLRGPSVNVQSACSTALVAVAMACQSLIDYQCDMALAGGVSIGNLPRSGYLYQEGGLLSPDGRCRAFDAAAQGTVGGDGVGVVVLKRLADALAEGDTIRAVIRGWAVNNDGGRKAGYTAPGVQGQTEVIALALALAGVDPASVTYVEAHGTGTPMGDPIEIAALTRAFRAGTGRAQPCAIGSVKSNIGHLDVASGVAGLIKTVLALEHRLLPPSLHFERPNPAIDFAGSPFYVNRELAEWRSDGSPRRAGVSSFGIGGTNAHVVLEEAPAAPAAVAAARPYELLVLSARTPAALEVAARNLANYLESGLSGLGACVAGHPPPSLPPSPPTTPPRGEEPYAGESSKSVLHLSGPAPEDETAAALASNSLVGKTASHASLPPGRGVGGDGGRPGGGWHCDDPSLPRTFLADVAHTLQVGRKPFEHRRAVVCRGREEAVAVLRGRERRRSATRSAPAGDPAVVFLFPGVGSQYGGMGAEIYRSEPLYRSEIDRCAKILSPRLGLDLRTLLLSGPEEAEEASRQLARPLFAMPALFTTEYALARLWMSWGVRPQAMIGHSLGEYVAACLAGVFSLEDALDLVALRGRLFDGLSGGAMLGIALPAAEARELLGEELSLAAINGPAQCVISGPEPAIVALAERLGTRGVEVRRVEIEAACHSRLVAPILPEFAAAAARIELHPPRLPLLSNVTGRWLRADEATDPGYWVRHLEQTVLFDDGLRELRAEPGRLLLEVGPGRTLSTLARLQGPDAFRAALSSMRHPHDPDSDEAFLLHTLGRLWALGVPVDWQAFAGEESRRRVPLPTYPFERQRYWLGGVAGLDAATVEPGTTGNPEPTHARPALAGPYTAPGSELERRLADLWQELLGISPVGVDDNFFELGGHSLLAGRLAALARQALGLEISMRSLFELPTIAQLARYLETSVETTVRPAPAMATPPLVPVPREGELPLSFPQQRLWFLEQLEPGSASYNVPTAVRLTGDLDVPALARAANEIVRHHEVLRTTFDATQGRPRQVIRSPRLLPLPVVDLAFLPMVIREEETARLAGEEAGAPFDLTRGPLLRGLLLRRAAADHVLLVTIHHIAADGGSMGVLVRELQALYTAFAAGRPSPLPELAIQYADFAVWQRRSLTGEVIERQLAYWRRRLAGAPALVLPTDRPRRPVQRFRGARRTFSLPAPLRQRIEALGRQAGSTPMMTLLAAFEILLQHESGVDDVVVGLDIANRDRPELEPLIGFFVNQLVLRVDLAGALSFREVLGRVRGVLLEAFEHRDLPFETLVAELSPGHDLSRTPLFQVKVAFQQEPPAPAQPPGLTVTALAPPSGETRFDLTLFLLDSGEEVTGALEYDSDLFDPETIARLADRFPDLVGRLTAEPDARLSEIRAAFDTAAREERRREGESFEAASLEKLASLKRKTPAVLVSTP